MTKRHLTIRQGNRLNLRQDHLRAQFQDHPELQKKGQVIAHHSKTCEIMNEEDNRSLICNLRQNLEPLVVGDYILWEPEGQNTGVITALLPRKGILGRMNKEGRTRLIAANVTQAVLVIAAIPTIQEALIDRHLVATAQFDLPTIIVFNKSDLLSHAEREQMQQRLQIYSQLGYPVFFVSTKQKLSLNPLITQLSAHTSVFIGQSGVGKSSLIAELLPGIDDIRVGAVSVGTGKGRHTTTTARLYYFPSGGKLIDSPGIRDFSFSHLTREQLARNFIEFREYLGHCKFANCSHTHEPDCAIHNAVLNNKISKERWHSYKQILLDL